MEEGLAFRWFAEEGVEDFLSRECRGQREITAGDPLGDAHQIRLHVFVFAGEHLAGAAEADGDFVADEQGAAAIAQLANAAEEAGWLDDHSGRALDNRLDANGGDRPRM